MEGNLINNILRQTRAPFDNVKVGDEATILGYTDRYPAKVVEILRTKKGEISCTVVEDDI